MMRARIFSRGIDGGAGSQQQVEGVGRQRPIAEEGPGLFDDGAHAVEEPVAIGDVSKGLPALDAAADYVVPRRGESMRALRGFEQRYDSQQKLESEIFTPENAPREVFLQRVEVHCR
jgi:hypothetical protein